MVKSCVSPLCLVQCFTQSLLPYHAYLLPLLFSNNGFGLCPVHRAATWPLPVQPVACCRCQWPQFSLVHLFHTNNILNINNMITNVHRKIQLPVVSLYMKILIKLCKNSTEIYKKLYKKVPLFFKAKILSHV